MLRGDKDIVCISATGSGKTLPFWIPLLFRPDGIQLVVTPLNILGSQNREQLARHGISAINITAETATRQNIEVSVTRSSPETYLLTFTEYGNSR